MTTLTLMPKKGPDSNQLAALIVARAAGLPTPSNLKKYDHLVKKTTAKGSRKPTKKQRD